MHTYSHMAYAYARTETVYWAATEHKHTHTETGRETRTVPSTQTDSATNDRNIVFMCENFEIESNKANADTFALRIVLVEHTFWFFLYNGNGTLRSCRLLCVIRWRRRATCARSFICRFVLGLKVSKAPIIAFKLRYFWSFISIQTILPRSFSPFCSHLILALLCTPNVSGDGDYLRCVRTCRICGVLILLNVFQNVICSCSVWIWIYWRITIDIHSGIGILRIKYRTLRHNIGI